MLVHYYGHVGGGSGYARAAEETCRALLKAGVDLRIRPLSAGGRAPVLPERHAVLEPYLRSDGDLIPEFPDIIIAHTLPLDCAKVIDIVCSEQARSRDAFKAIAYTTWEGVDGPSPVFRQALAGFDRVWMPNQLMTDFRYDVMPHACGTPAAAVPPADMGQHPFRFYFIGTWSRRKNPDGLIRAYLHAFGRDDDVELVMVCADADPNAFPAAIAATGVESDMPRIRLHRTRASDSELADLHQKADCFVTATRGEAWNLPAFDALAAGRHVITQAGLGSDMFLAKTSACRLHHGLLQPAYGDAIIGADGSIGARLAQGLSSRSLWVEPDLIALSNAMRYAFKHQKRTIKLEYDIEQEFGYTAVGTRCGRLLEEAWKS